MTLTIDKTTMDSVGSGVVYASLCCSALGIAGLSGTTDPSPVSSSTVLLRNRVKLGFRRAENDTRAEFRRPWGESLDWFRVGVLASPPLESSGPNVRLGGMFEYTRLSLSRYEGSIKVPSFSHDIEMNGYEEDVHDIARGHRRSCGGG